MPKITDTLTPPSTCAQLNNYSNLEGGVLPYIANNWIGTDGLLTTSGAQSFIDNLRTVKIIPTAPDLSKFNTKTWTSPEQAGGNNNDPLAGYVQSQNKLISDLEKEFNYVKSYYEKAISCLVQAITSFTTETIEANRNSINTNQVGPYRLKSIEFNKKLNLLLDAMRKISEALLEDSQGYNTAINGFNTEFGNRKARLQEQASILESENSASELHKRMVEYSAEKNRAHNNLLTLYSCLNIVAIAMLFYIAK